MNKKYLSILLIAIFAIACGFIVDTDTKEATNSTAMEETSFPALNAPQILDPVDWAFSKKDLGNDEYELQFKATIEPHWHVYSQNIEGDGPIPTSFTFEEVKGYELIDKVKEPKPISEFDPNFQMQLNWFENSVTFKQKVKITAEGKTTVKGYLEYMTCDEKQCLPPEYVDFSFELEGKKAEEPANENNKEEDKTEENETGDTEAEVDTAAASANVDSADVIPDVEVVEELVETPIETTPEEGEKGSSLLAIFIAGFLGGLLALLTPCVFPMIPLTVSFFTKQSTNRAKGISNAILYGISIIVIYVLLAYGVTAIFGADSLNALSTNVWFNLAFFIMFVVFAISFFGAFEITLPSSWVNKADQASNKGGLVGIFFMAFTLSLVSFSCTGPIIGTLLVEAAVNGGIIGPVTGMFGFSLALALPFALFAAFPGWLNSLPQSGGWLNSVKVTLGFLELALALKFLSNADLVVQAGLLKRELFIAIWIGIFGLLSLYLMGAFKLPHDSTMDRLPIPRMLFAMVTIVFTLYLIPGLWGAPLKIISGFPPPMFYSESPNGVGGSAPVLLSQNAEKVPDGADPKHCPHELNCFHDYETALEYAKEVNKPLMLDFTGWACVNCRKMEEQVWSDPKVLQRLRNDVVLVSLYVDEKTELPKDEQIEVTIGDKKKTLRTIGNKWSYFQATRFETNSQPQYILLDHDEKMLIETAAYDPDINLFVDWLDRGKKAFREKSNS